MCEAIVLCETGDSKTQYTDIPKDRSFTLYHLQTRTFWSQISTIWEWFIANFDSDSLAATGHTRPVTVHSVTDGIWSAAQTAQAHLSLDPAIIVIDGHTIDRIKSQWLHGPDLQPAGYCQRMPLWESLDTITRQLPAGKSP